MSHRQVCSLEKETECVFGCNNGIKYKGKAQLIDHALSDCIKIEMICLTCGAKNLREEMDSHDCLAFIMETMDCQGPEALKKVIISHF